MMLLKGAHCHSPSARGILCKMLLPEMVKGEHQQELLLMNQMKNQRLATGKPGMQVKLQRRKPECDGLFVEEFDR